MNGAVFIKYLCQCLVPTLRPGDIVIINNLLAHKRQEVRELIEAAISQLRYLPPHSPDLNRSNTLSQNSRLTCARPSNARFLLCMIASSPPNVETASEIQDTPT